MTLTNAALFGGAGHTLSLAGDGTVVLPTADGGSNANTINPAGVTLPVTNAAALGANTLSFTSGVLRTPAGLGTLSNVSFTNNGRVALVAAGPIVLDGTVTLSGNNTIDMLGQTVTIAPGTTFAGTGSLTFVGTGGVDIPGAITITNSIGVGGPGVSLTLGNAGSLGVGRLRLAGGTVTATVPLAAGGVVLAGGVNTLNGTFAFSGGGISSPRRRLC